MGGGDGLLVIRVGSDSWGVDRVVVMGAVVRLVVVGGVMRGIWVVIVMRVVVMTVVEMPW